MYIYIYWGVDHSLTHACTLMRTRTPSVHMVEVHRARKWWGGGYTWERCWINIPDGTARKTGLTMAGVCLPMPKTWSETEVEDGMTEEVEGRDDKENGGK